MKKLLASSTILTMMMVAMPALAYGGHHGSDSDVRVENDNWACVSNTVDVTAQTGGNEVVSVKGGDNTGGDIDTGDAWATSYVGNTVNSNETKIKASCRRGCTGDVKVENDNGAMVRNEVDITAQTGGNEIITVKGGSNSGDIDTGIADAYSEVINVVNTNITRVRR